MTQNITAASSHPTDEIKAIMDKMLGNVKPGRGIVHSIFTDTLKYIKALWLAQVEYEAKHKSVELQAACLELIRSWELFLPGYNTIHEYTVGRSPLYSIEALLLMHAWEKEEAAIRSFLDEAAVLNDIEQHYMQIWKAANDWRLEKMEKISDADSLQLSNN